MKVNVIYLGRLECYKYHLIKCENKEEMIKSPISAVLIQHPELGNILYDTGNSPFYASEYPESTLETYPVAEFISIEQGLNSKGLTPDDIDMIILSHMHFDHAGGLRYFKGTKAIRNVIVSEAELKNAYYNVVTGHQGAYVKSLFDMEGIQYSAIEHDTMLAENVRLFIQNSHTPGVIGLELMDTSSGNIIFTGDTIYTKEAYENMLPPGGTINKTDQEFYDNLEIVKKMQKEKHATLIFGHDYEQIVEWSHKTIF